MDDTVNVRVRLEHLIYAIFIGDVDLVEVWSFTAEEFNAIEGHFRGIVKTVDDDNLVSMLEEGERCERPDITGSSAPLMLAFSHETVAVVGFLRPAQLSSAQLHTCLTFGSYTPQAGKNHSTYPVTKTVPTDISALDEFHLTL